MANVQALRRARPTKITRDGGYLFRMDIRFWPNGGGEVAVVGKGSVPHRDTYDMVATFARFVGAQSTRLARERAKAKR